MEVYPTKKIINLNSYRIRKGKIKFYIILLLNRAIQLKITKLNDIIENEYLIVKLKLVLTPFKFIFGLVSLLISASIFLSMFMVLLDRLLNSTCGWKCGFTIDKSQFNSIVEKTISLFSQNYLYFDFYLIIILVLYIFICTIYGVLNLGIRLICIEMFSFKKQLTSSQGLLCLSGILSILSLSAITIINFLGKNIFSINNGLLNYKEIKDNIVYFDLIITLSSIIFCLIFVYSMSVSYSITNYNKNKLELDVFEEDEEKLMLNMA